MQTTERKSGNNTLLLGPFTMKKRNIFVTNGHFFVNKLAFDLKTCECTLATTDLGGNSVHNIKTHQRQAIVKNPFAKVIKTPWNINSNAFKI